MKGSTLLAAMSYVDDALVQEAEDRLPAGKVIPLHTVRWAAALAACVCILVGWAVFAPALQNAANFSGGGKSSTAADTTAMEATNEAAPVSEESFDNGAAPAEGGAEEEAAAESSVLTGGAQAPAESADGAEIDRGTGKDSYSGIIPISIEAVRELRVTHSLAGREETYTGADAAAVAEYINGLTLTEDFDENPNESVGGTYTLEFEMEDGTTRIFYHFGNAFFCEEDGPWYRMEYEEAARLGSLLGYVIFD